MSRKTSALCIKRIYNTCCSATPPAPPAPPFQSEATVAIGDIFMYNNTPTIIFNDDLLTNTGTTDMSLYTLSSVYYIVQDFYCYAPSPPYLTTDLLSTLSISTTPPSPPSGYLTTAPVTGYTPNVQTNIIGDISWPTSYTSVGGFTTIPGMILTATNSNAQIANIVNGLTFKFNWVPL